MRVVFGLVTACMLVVPVDGVMARTTEPEAGPVVLGGRIEVPAAGFAVSVPEGWYAFDITHPDLVAELETFDEMTALVAPEFEGLPMPPLLAALTGVELLLLAFDTDVEASCHVMAGRVETDSVDVVVSEQAEWMRTSSGVEGEIDLAFIDLPAGRAGVLEYTEPQVPADEKTEFILVHDGRSYTLSCEDSERRADRWFSIAETIEFLPAEE